MNWLRTLDLKTAGYVNIAVIIIAIIVHLLVIFQILPFTWINGGRSASLADAQQTSVISIAILIAMILVNLWACALLPVKGLMPLLRVLLWVLFAYSILGMIQQLLGTAFERFSMSILCIISAVMYFRLAIH